MPVQTADGRCGNGCCLYRRMTGESSGGTVQKVEFGWPIGMPYCRSLSCGLWEVRSNLPGGRIARVVFCIVAGEMILLHGFEKNSQKTLQRDIELALNRKQEIDE